MRLAARSRPAKPSTLGAITVLVAALIAPVALAGPAAGQGTPVVTVFLPHGGIDADHFPANSTITFTVAAIGFSQDVVADGDGHAEVQVPFETPLESGMVVSATDGTTPKDVTIAVLSVDAFDLEADVVTGSAAPGAAVDVGVDCCPGGDYQFATTADSAGTWQVDTTGAGADLTTTTIVHAAVTEGDGDATMLFKHPPNIYAAQFTLKVDGFFPDTLVSVDIFESPGGRLVLATTGRADEHGSFQVLTGGSLLSVAPGMFIRATDGLYSKALTVEDVTVDIVNPIDNIVSGQAPPGSLVQLFVEDLGGGNAHLNDIPVDGTGAWTADLDDVGFDFGDETGVTASIWDSDGDTSAVERFAPILGVVLEDNALNVSNFNPGLPTTFRVLDGPGGTEFDSGTVTVGADGAATFTPTVALAGGMEVSAADAHLSFSLEIPNITLDAFDVVADTASGTADPFATIAVATDLGCGLAEHGVTADASGNWSTDFFIPDAGVRSDLRSRIMVCAGNVLDAQFEPIVSADPLNNTIAAHGFEPGATVTFSKGGVVAGSATVAGHLRHAEISTSVNPGMVISATDGTTTKEVTVVDLTVDVADPISNEISGRGPASTDLLGEFDPQGHFRVTSDPDGAWTFTVPVSGDGDHFGFGSAAEISAVDTDGDRTAARKGAVERVSASVAAGGSLTSDTEADGATEDDAFETTVTTPNAGTVTIEEQAPLFFSGPSTFVFLGQQVEITAPPATAARPLELRFRVDATQIPARESAATMQIFRDGSVVPECATTSGAADPDPCVLDRNDLGDGDAELVVVSSRASTWDAGASNDTAVPTTSALTLSLNPKPTDNTSVLTLTASDTGSGIARGEYFIGSDPGVGKGTPMTLSGTSLKATIGTNLAAGSYTIKARARDQAGNWSTTRSVVLKVTTPAADEPPPDLPPPPVKSGYWMLSAIGGVYAFGDAQLRGHGSSSRPFVDIEGSPSGNGYWVVDTNGDVEAFGDAVNHGSLHGQLAANEVVTSLAATASGKGYWLFTSLGRAIAFGDARHFGDMAGVTLNGPVLDSIVTPSGLGYYLVASDGGIFAFGDAAFRGSMGATPLNAPVLSLAPDGDGAGYWLVAADGGIFAFDAAFHGSMGGVPLNEPVTGIVSSGTAGYLMVAEDGGIFAFGSAPFHGSLGATPPISPIVAVAAL